MKTQTLLLFQQKLVQNMIRSGRTTNHTTDIKFSEKTQQINAEIVHQVEKTQSSDYNTKAIATRLRSIAQRRIVNAAKQEI